MRAQYYNSAYLMFGNSAILNDQIQDNYAGMRLFRAVFNVFAINMTFYDRTGAIDIPFKMKQVDKFDLPIGEKFRPQPKTFEEICHIRAVELMDMVKRTNRKLVVMYSGGIDSTLLLVTLFKACSDKDIRENVIVIMNGVSVEENKNFFRHHIMKRVDQIYHSNTFTYLLGHPGYVIVSGEGNDQLFGSAVSQNYFLKYGLDALYEPLEPSRIIEFYNDSINVEGYAEKLYILTQRVADRCPVPVNTPYLFFWWLNLACKFQSVFVRTSSYTRDEFQPTLKYNDNYQMFFDNEDFQLWSMNNTDNLIVKDWKTYKQHCKEIIYEFNKDDDYRINKTKWGSLRAVLLQKRPTIIIDDQMKFHYEFPEELLLERNSFSEIC